MSTTPEPVSPAAPPAASPARRAAPAGPQPRGVTLVVTLLLFGVLALWRLHEHYPPWPNPLGFELTLEPGVTGRSDPLIVTGGYMHGDFLAVRFDDPQTVRFLYDSWGIPGLRSDPVRLPPDRRLRLRVAMPSLDQMHGHTTPGAKRVTVEANGVRVLDAEVHYYVRAPHRIFFGENPLGGTSCGPALRGEIRLDDGRLARGGPGPLVARRDRVADWFIRLAWQPAVLLVIAFLTARNLHRLRAAPRWLAAARQALLRHRIFVFTTAACTAGYAWLVTFGTFNVNDTEIFGSFYDFQAASFLEGRLDVPDEAIRGEAFEARGKLYGYFGPTPAVLRLPFVVAGLAFAKLSRALMLVYFAGTLTAAYLILCDARRRRSPAHGGAPPAFATIVLLVSTGLGSTVFFLGSRALIFHEAILSGIAFALWSAWCALRLLHAPASRWWLGALVCGVASVHCRPPTGLFALTLLGCVALAGAWRESRTRGLAAVWPRAIVLGALSVAGFFSLNVLAWFKFRTFDPAPLAISRPYMGTDRLAHVDGKSFHLVNLPYNFHTYITRPNFSFTRNFPWIYHGPPLPGDRFPRAKIDLPDHTVAIPYSMPALFALATLGCLGAWLAAPFLRPALGCLWAAVLPMTLALFAAIATAQRYTGDFCPFLIATAAVALAGLETGWTWLRRPAQAGLVVLTAAGVAVTFALTIHYQGETLWGVPDAARASYRALRTQVDGFFGVPPLPPPQP